MRPPRKILRLISCPLIALLLFAQAAFAAQPCVEPGMSAASAMAHSGSDDCCGGRSVSETNLCAVACTDENKLVGSGEFVSVPARVDVALLVLPPLEPALPGLAVAPQGTALAAAPPKSILFCSILV